MNNRPNRRTPPKVMMPAKVDLAILIEEKGWHSLKSLKSKLHKAAETAFATLQLGSPPIFKISLLLTDNQSIQTLNRNFRGQARATNVLAFPQFNPTEIRRMVKKNEEIELGDIALAYQYIVVESKKDHKMLINHITHLLIHGIFHLLGYDHMSDIDALKMERIEKKAMKTLGLSDPYAVIPLKKPVRRQKK